MANKTKTSLSAPETQEKYFLIVNPRGTMHVVGEVIARDRLRQAGWRMATTEERAAYKVANGNQRAGRPLAAPFSPVADMAAALDFDGE